MKKNRLWKILGIIVLGLIVLILCGIGYIVWFLPKIQVHEIMVNSSAELIAAWRLPCTPCNSLY